MDLTRLFGYEIEPQRTVEEDLFNPPLGGELAIGESLRVALDNSLRVAQKSNKMTEVVLRVDEDPDRERTCPVRDAVLEVAFGDESAAAAGADWLAAQLSRAMDERSKDCLLLIAAYGEDGKKTRRVAAWIFPQDEAFRFTAGKEGNDIELLTEIFSRTSALRKMAVFEGKRLATNFITADVLDFQFGRADDVADFWITQFLEARLSITSAAGTKVLADALKRASEADISPAENEQVHNAAIAIRTMPQSHWSLEEVANTFLSGNAREVFLAAAPNDIARTSSFKMDRPALERGLSFRNFKLTKNVYVSAPIEEVGEDKIVRVERAEGAADDGTGEKVHIDAEIVQDRLGSRHV
ncbi:MAG TPA: nucleoid-associated protein [Solirubrobacterales bacterium]